MNISILFYHIRKQSILSTLLALIIGAFPSPALADNSSGNQEDRYEFQYTYPAETGATLTYTPPDRQHGAGDFPCQLPQSGECGDSEEGG